MGFASIYKLTPEPKQEDDYEIDVKKAHEDTDKEEFKPRKIIQESALAKKKKSKSKSKHKKVVKHKK